ncbi:MAG: alpha/beta hydrolase [Sneathiella sp.]
MTKIKTTILNAGGNDIQFLEKGDGPLLLCLHGFPDHAWSFEQQLHFFADQGYRVVAPFMRGYGPSLAEENPTFTAFDTGQDALSLIDALGYETATLIGHDWGASAAYVAAFLAPKKINKLVTVAVPYGRQFMASLLQDADQQRRSWYMFYFLAPFAEKAVSLNNFAFIDRLWSDWSPSWNTDNAYLDKLKETLSKPGVLECALAYYRDTFNPMKPRPVPQDDRANFGKSPIKVPSLYIHGQQDGCISPELGIGMNALFPAGLQTILMPDAGHFLHLEKPDLFNQSVSDFLQNKKG